MTLPAGFFSPPANRCPWIKWACYGPAGSGKTRLLVRLGVGLWRLCGSKPEKPVAFLETEPGLGNLLDSLEGVPFVHRASRSVADLLASMEAAREGAFSGLVIDSITAFWESWLALEMEQRGVVSRQLSASERGDIKASWRKLVGDPIREDPCHYLLAGRASAEWDSEEDRDTGRRESYRSGSRLRAEADIGYETGFLVRMDRVERPTATGALVYRTATVEKDRTGIVDGKTFGSPERYPAFEDFAPAFEKIISGVPASPVPVVRLAPPLLFKGGPSESRTEKARQDRKALMLEEIDGWMEREWPGSGKDALAAKNGMRERIFGTIAPSYAKALEAEELAPKHEALARAIHEKTGRFPLSCVLVPAPAALPPPATIEAPADLFDARGPLAPCGHGAAFVRDEPGGDGSCAACEGEKNAKRITDSKAPAGAAASDLSPPIPDGVAAPASLPATLTTKAAPPESSPSPPDASACSSRQTGGAAAVWEKQGDPGYPPGFYGENTKMPASSPRVTLPASAQGKEETDASPGLARGPGSGEGKPCGPACWTSVDCAVCGRIKAPSGRSMPAEMVRCDDDCPGYRQDPKPPHLWDVHDSSRVYNDPSGWAEHAATCYRCKPEGCVEEPEEGEGTSEDDIRAADVALVRSEVRAAAEASLPPTDPTPTPPFGNPAPGICKAFLATDSARCCVLSQGHEGAHDIGPPLGVACRVRRAGSADQDAWDSWERHSWKGKETCSRCGVKKDAKPEKPKRAPKGAPDPIISEHMAKTPQGEEW